MTSDSTPPTPATEEPWEGPLTDKENAMLEAEARWRIAEINEDLAMCQDVDCAQWEICHDCYELREERRDLRAYLDSLKGETA